MMRSYFVILIVCLLTVSCGSERQKKDDLKNLSWDEITQGAEGQTVNWMMWQGSPYVNNYINNYVIPEVKERYNITLEISSGQGNQIVSTLLTEIDAGKEVSDIDLAWINGETFYQLREINALYGPFTDQLPNSDYVDFDNPIIKYDFQKPVNGYEAPWSLTQWSMIYNSEKVDNPPRNMEELEAYVKANPGTFTIPNQFVGMTFLKNLMIEMAGPEALSGDFDAETYQKYSSRLWEYLNRIKPYFWKDGQTFPSTPAAMNQLFSNGEINFSMNFGTRIDNAVDDGTYPTSARVYLLESGTIQNANYVGIPKKSAHKAAAMVVANFLLSPEAQYKKMQPNTMANNTVLAVDKLPENWQQKFNDIPESNYAPPREELSARALQELGPEYMIRLNEDFRTKVIQQ